MTGRLWLGYGWAVARLWLGNAKAPWLLAQAGTWRLAQAGTWLLARYGTGRKRGAYTAKLLSPKSSNPVVYERSRWVR